MLHKGKGLFCTKKPPKAEVCDNENTHYQRAHVKNVKMHFLSSKVSKENRELAFARSIDDKAYVRPGTSEGFEKTRNVRIITLSDDSRARHLPKYDWPGKLVHVTSSAHRIFTENGNVINDEEILHKELDEHVVFLRPKSFVNSGGTTWANETMRVRHILPYAFEVSSNRQHSLGTPALTTALCKLKDAVFYFKDMTLSEDCKRCSPTPGCIHRTYPRERLMHVNSQINKT